MADGFDYVIPPAIEALGEDERQEFIRQIDVYKRQSLWVLEQSIRKQGGYGEEHARV